MKKDKSYGYYMDLDDTWISGRRYKEAVITHVAPSGRETRIPGVSYLAPAHPRWAFDEAAALAKLEPVVEFLRDYKRRTGQRFERVDKRSLVKLVADRERRKKARAKAKASAAAPAAP